MFLLTFSNKYPLVFLRKNLSPILPNGNVWYGVSYIPILPIVERYFEVTVNSSMNTDC
jgi:hypothetical protein